MANDLKSQFKMYASNLIVSFVTTTLAPPKELLSLFHAVIDHDDAKIEELQLFIPKLTMSDQDIVN